MIKPPIICADREGWIKVFRSFEDAEKGPEQNDIEGREYVTYDSSGTRLVYDLEPSENEAQRGAPGWKRFFPPRPPVIRLKVRDGEGYDELRVLLIDALARAGADHVAMEGWPVSELVDRAADLSNRLDLQANPLRVTEIRRKWGYGP
jgi:hypothetical protein